MKLSLAASPIAPARQASQGAAASGRSFWWWLGAILSVAVALASGRYLLGVGPVPDLIAENAFKYPWLYVHIAFAVIALAVSPFQFLKHLRARKPRVHRWLGRLYALACLLGGFSGLVLAFGTSTGIVSTLGFGSLAVIWMATTALAWRRALERRFPEHRAWMIRSFALTFAAVNLRLYLPLIGLLPVPFVVGYQAVSFLAWLPNLLVAELYLRRRMAGRASLP